MITYEHVCFDSIKELEYSFFKSKYCQYPTFNAYAFMEAYNNLPGCSTECIVVKDDGEQVGVFSYVKRRKWGMMVIESMPFSLYGGPIVADKYLNGLLQYFVESIINKSIVYETRIFLPRLLTGVENAELARWGFEIISNKAAVVKLPDSEDALLKSYKHNVRKNINKAKREGVVITEVSSTKELYEFYKLAKYIYEFHNSKMPYSYDIYLNMFEKLVKAGLARFNLAKLGDTIIAGGVHFYDEAASEVFNWLTPSYREYQQYRANTLLIHEVMKDAMNKGYKTYNLGASPEGEKGLLNFKHNWGAFDREYSICIRRNILLSWVNF